MKARSGAGVAGNVVSADGAEIRNILGVSPREFLIKTRVLAACHALRQTSAPLADVAADCGFCDQSSFTRHCRRHVGQTLREYRAAMTA